MFENLCTLPLSSELFTQALHPKEPILAVGLSGGHVQSFRLPLVAGASSDDEDGDTSVLSTGTSTIDTEWRTRRHKGSCRTLTYSNDGEVLYSAGTDGLLKAASSSTGQVVSKILVPFGPSGSADPPTHLHALSPQTLLLATDSAALHIFDLRAPSTLSSKPSQTHHPHEDYISSLTPLPPTEASTSGFSKQWVTTGGTTLAVTDLRRGVLVKSENQEEELLSSVFVGGLPSKPGRSKGEKVLVGSSNGVLTLWERGVWDDQDERIYVDVGRGGGESLDSLAVMPEGVGDGGKNVVVGVGDGTIRIVQLGPNKIVGETLRHDEVEGVVGLGFDVGGRLISGGGSIVKVWQEKLTLDDEDEDEDDSDEGETSAKKRTLDGSASDGSDEADAEDSSDEEGERKRRKKRRKAKGKKESGNGILGFKGLE
ncbi:WD40 repeat-like protein [Hyaloscypha bicolor E]|uniref:WD repeat-containing protein JIP5 n=1 Tax=Hyaloscypha bicolor E TaxID=1095630 RepID=A0A2J6SKM5_9HELO|nr:WD40 repeat-like protein [Hyaloscypha bicolor E]PMD51307.1 WD40 repeat-like protein [Hyaloscypha bicolor E]